MQVFMGMVRALAKTAAWTFVVLVGCSAWLIDVRTM
jgi:uncharacterized membrane protein